MRISVPKKHLKLGNVILGILFSLAVLLRFYNYENFLFFVYDQGRDALKLQKIVEGDITLIGPTSGLEGFFLGPLWYYVGVPGYLLSNGNPYGISLWYIFISLFALCAFIVISKIVFPKNFLWQNITFALLAFIPASINGSTFIWNPLLSLPLMASALVAFFYARTSRVWLMLAFLLLGFVLQSEFAYGVFIVPILFLIIYWIRKGFSIVDYLLAAVSVGITLVPQIVFELKNNFLMSQALFRGTASSSNTIPLLSLWTKRPLQLFDSTELLLFGGSNATPILAVFVICIIFFAVWKAWKNKTYEWQLISIITIIPYLGFMMWRGNYGNFFEYYLAPHFIFLVLMLVYGLQEINRLDVNLIFAPASNKKIREVVIIVVLTTLFTFSWININNRIFTRDNQAGLKIIELATVKTLTYQSTDQAIISTNTNTPFNTTITTFTPNYLTAQYDFVMDWKTKETGLPMPNTQVRPDDVAVYLIIEPDREIPEKRFSPWYTNATEGRVRVRKERVGILVLETWMEPKVAQENNYTIRHDTIMEKMGWL